jgi:hypothetical protein
MSARSPSPSPPGLTPSRRDYRAATVKELSDAGLPPTQTGRNRFHYTVELPQPVTPGIADIFNNVFKAP